MRLTWRDGLATSFVGAAVLLYALWLGEIDVFGISGRGVAAVVLGLGLAASVTAVVYGVGIGLLRASKVYLVIASVFGIVALVAGVVALVNGNEAMVATLLIATIVLWLMSTTRHAVVRGAARDEPEERRIAEAGSDQMTGDRRAA